MADPDLTHPHLEIVREEPATERRSRPVPVSRKPPDDPRDHGAELRNRLRAARNAVADDLGGYDERRLIKIELAEKVSPEDIARASGGLEIVSQEEGTLVLAFATEDELEAFEAKLGQLASGAQVTYQNLIYALRSFDRWTPGDRTGWALRRDGFPRDEPFLIDVELWPLARGDQATRLRSAFETWVREHDGEMLDSVRQPYLSVYRIRCSRTLAEDLLSHRDIRAVDLPPRVGVDLKLLFTPVQDLEQTPAPPEDAPGITVLDSGIVTGHPVLGPAVGDAQSFIPGASAADEHGHGTFVSGIALYDDVADRLRKHAFVPELRIFSGRILDNQNRGDPYLIENQVENAVRYFVDEYGCRIFNISYGDFNKPYRNRHVAGLAVTLDALSRELDVLFVVPTGNYVGDDTGPCDWRAEYPEYLTGDASKLLNPAPALSALTVGSLARNERNSRWPNDPNYRPVARSDQPSPFTRHGPSVNGAIKPDVVDYGGNMMIDARAGGHPMSGPHGSGELSTSIRFATGQPFAEDSGTSFAAPRVANAAAHVLKEYQNASVDRCRALLVTHARTPSACSQLFAGDGDTLRNVVGYGLVDRSALYRSLEACVTLWAEEAIENRRHHFYELPVPDEFWSPGRRDREITVGLSFRPSVRTTRIEYRAAAISFKLVQAGALDEVVDSFNAAVDVADTTRVQERQAGRRFSETIRSRGTVQASTWTFRQPSAALRDSSWFVVVTRNDPSWGANLSSERESYSLVVTVADRSAQEPRLYARIEALLRARARLRARV
jgi:hypothetical protein